MHLAELVRRARGPGAPSWKEVNSSTHPDHEDTRAIPERERPGLRPSSLLCHPRSSCLAESERPRGPQGHAKTSTEKAFSGDGELNNAKTARSTQFVTCARCRCVARSPIGNDGDQGRLRGRERRCGDTRQGAGCFRLKRIRCKRDAEGDSQLPVSETFVRRGDDSALSLSSASLPHRLFAHQTRPIPRHDAYNGRDGWQYLETARVYDGVASTGESPQLIREGSGRWRRISGTPRAGTRREFTFTYLCPFSLNGRRAYRPNGTHFSKLFAHPQGAHARKHCNGGQTRDREVNNLPRR
ncbi:hypothetical protein BD309DRAFT_183663 [Dichomitus squalens]|nr:hypothetical protein BD309DRAFT_183663 [Dichomitus squalens]